MRKGEIDYRMQRRAVLLQVQQGEVPLTDVQVAHRELVRAGTHIGRELDDPCPMCDGSQLRAVTYLFTGRAAKGKGEGGAAVPPAKLDAALRRAGDCKVYEVEVCIDCGWHHLLESYWWMRQPAPRSQTTRA
jgi:hypothetical protein